MQSAGTFSRVLIAQHPDVAAVIPAQPVRAEPSVMAVVAGSKWTLAHDRCPNQPVNVLN